MGVYKDFYASTTLDSPILLHIMASLCISMLVLPAINEKKYSDLAYTQVRNIST